MITLRSVARLGALGALGALALSITACGTMKTYRLPTPAAGADAAFAAIDACAKEQGLETSRGSRGVNVKSQADAWLYYNTDPSGGLQLALSLTGPHAAATPDSAIFKATKAKADAVWACAEGRAAAAPAPPPGPTKAAEPAPAPEPAPSKLAPAPAAATRWPTACAQLVDCYLEITKALCQGATSCKSEVKVQGNPTEDDCRGLLRDSKDLIEPIRMLRPDFSKPAACVVR